MTLIIVFAVFSPVLQNDFVNWDDEQYLSGNTSIRSVSVSSIRRMFAETILDTYTPLTSLSFALEYALFGLVPSIYHLTNLLLHLGVTGLVFLFALQLGLNHRAAVIATLCFGIHPMHVESVAWVTERKDVLYSFFYMAALCSYWQYLKEKLNNRRRLKFYVLSLIAAFLSMLAKPMALSLPLILFLCDWFCEREWSRNILFEKIPFFIIVVPLAWMTYSLNARLPQMAFPVSLLVWVWTLTFYLWKFMMPFVLLPLYPVPAPISLANWHYIFPWGILALWYWLITTKNRLLIFVSLFYLLSIFFLLRYDVGVDASVVADRFMYLPSLGFCIFGGYIFDRFLIRFLRKGARVVLIPYGFLFILILLLSLKTNHQIKVWKNGVTLWNHSLRYWPDQPKFYFNRAEAYLKESKQELALRDYDKAAEVDPQFREQAYHNKGMLYFQNARYELALDNFQAALSISPNASETHRSIGDVYQKLQQYEKALEHYNTALASEPRKAEIYLSRAIVYGQQQQFEQSLLDIHTALKLAPRYALAFYNRAIVYQALGRYESAVKDMETALAIDPYFAGAYFTRGNWYLQERKFGLAVKDYNKAIVLNSHSGDYFYNRGLVRIHLKEFSAALNDFSKAVELNPDATYAYFQKARIYLLQGKNDRAMQEYNAIIALDPNAGPAYYNRSMIFAAKNGLKKAWQDAQQAVSLGENVDAAYIEHLENALGQINE